jgi:Uma2 family endonuclease
LQAGDHLTRPEFERRYAAMPEDVRAELVEGRVYMLAAVRAERHGGPHLDLVTWMGVYKAATPGVVGFDNSSLRLDLDNMPQPDGALCLPNSAGGRSRIDADGHLSGAPELIVEVAASSANYDLHDKLEAYRRNGVQEYLVWLTVDEKVRWFELEEGRYVLKSPQEDGLLKSRVFPGLWLDVNALFDDDLARVLAVLQTGLADAEHLALVEKLRGGTIESGDPK